MHNRNTRTTNPDAALTQRVITDQQWARDHSLELSQRYPNQWIAIHEQRVVATDPDQWQCTVLAQERSQFPITFVHTCPPRVPGIADAVISPPVLDAIPADIRAAGRPIDARMLATELRDFRYRSVSFDLHGTLVLPRIGWNERIADAFRSVLIEHGFRDVIARIESEFGQETAWSIAGVAKFWYRCCAISEELHVERRIPLPFQPWDPGVRWPLANSYALASLVVGEGGEHLRDDRMETALDPFFDRLRARARTQALPVRPIDRRRARAEFPDVAAVDLPRAVEEVRVDDEWTQMGVEVHERIAGSAPEDWYPTEEQRVVLRTALEHGHLCCILSNGSAEAVQHCVATHLPGIPPWQVFTPETFHCAGKPSPVNAVLLLASIGSAIVRNAIEGRSAPDSIVAAVTGRDRSRLRERWQRAHARLTRTIATSLDPSRGDTALTVARGALAEFARALRLPPSAHDAITVLPHEHLHVGNSDYHDELPVLGLGLPFPCVRYAPADAPAPARAVRLFPATALHPVPGFDDRNGAP